ncbi:MAG: DUF1638 domain-containing protein [Opitutales bacterium]
MSCALLASDVFSAELELLGHRLPVRFLEMGLHEHPARLRVEIQAAIEKLEAEEGVDTILLAYGLCGNALDGVQARQARLILPRTHDCITLLMGGNSEAEQFRIQNPDTFFASEGWFRGGLMPGAGRDAFLRKLYSERHPDDEGLVEDLLEAAQETYASYRRLHCLETVGGTGFERNCAACAAAMGWEKQTVRGDLALLHDLLHGSIDPERFLIIEPGHAICADPGGKVMRAVATRETVSAQQ